MPEKSSQEEALKKLSNSQLIEVVRTLQQNEKKLFEEMSSLKKELAASKAASTDASVAASRIIAEAKSAAEKHLESVRDMSEKAKVASTRVVDAAEKQAAAIISDAELQAQEILDKANSKARNAIRDANKLVKESDYIPSADKELDSDDSYSVPKASDYLEKAKKESSRDYLPKLPFEARFVEGLVDYDRNDDLVDAEVDFEADDDDYSDDEGRVRPEDIMAPTVMITLEDDDDDGWGSSYSNKEPKSAADYISDFDPLADAPARYFDNSSVPEKKSAAADSLNDNLKELNDLEKRALDYLNDQSTKSDSTFYGNNTKNVTQKPTNINSLNNANANEAAPSATDSDSSVQNQSLAEAKSPENAEKASKDGSRASSIKAPDPNDVVSENDASAEMIVETIDNNVSAGTNDRDSASPKKETLSRNDSTQYATESFEPLDPSISGLLSMSKAERKAAKKAAKKAKKAMRRAGRNKIPEVGIGSSADVDGNAAKSSAESLHSQKTGEMEPVVIDEESGSIANSAIDGSQTQEKVMAHARQVLKTTAVPEIMQSSYENFISANHVQNPVESDFDSCFDDADV